MGGGNQQHKQPGGFVVLVKRGMAPEAAMLGTARLGMLSKGGVAQKGARLRSTVWLLTWVFPASVEKWRERDTPDSGRICPLPSEGAGNPEEIQNQDVKSLKHNSAASPPRRSRRLRGGQGAGSVCGTRRGTGWALGPAGRRVGWQRVAALL